MAVIESRVEELVEEDPDMRAALETVLERTGDESDEDEAGTLSWSDVREDLTSGQWGRLIEMGILEDDGSGGFQLADPDSVRSVIYEDGDGDGESEMDDIEGSSWSTWDKVAALGSVGMFAGYSVASVRNAVGRTIDVVLGPIDAALPFYAVVLVLALFTGLYSTLLQANLMNMDKISKYQGRMEDIQERRKAAKERGDDEALDRIQEEQMDAMSDQLGMFKEQFRPMVWIMLFTIPAFLWMFWMIRTQTLVPETIVFPILGQTQWTEGVVGPIRTWIVWYFVCSMGFSQIIRKALNIQTTPGT